MNTFTLDVMPGICGYTCKVRSSRTDKGTARVEIVGSGCAMIQEFSIKVADISMQDIFAPLTQNKIFQGAEIAGCHLACPVPLAVAKAA